MVLVSSASDAALVRTGWVSATWSPGPTPRSSAALRANTIPGLPTASSPSTAVGCQTPLAKSTNRKLHVYRGPVFFDASGQSQFRLGRAQHLTIHDARQLGGPGWIERVKLDCQPVGHVAQQLLVALRDGRQERVDRPDQADEAPPARPSARTASAACGEAPVSDCETASVRIRRPEAAAG